MNETTLTGADAVALALEDLGVDIVFAITGAGNLAICDAIDRRGFTRMIFVHHEQAALMAAQGMTRSTGKLGVVIVTTGGGSTNALTGIVGANMDSIPLVLISGNESSIHTNTDNELRIWGVQGFDSRQVFAPIAKESHRLRSSENAYDAVINAALKAQEPRAGVVTLDIPMDLQRKSIVAPPSIAKAKLRNLVSDQTMTRDSNVQFGVKTALNLLAKAERPLLLLGAGLKYFADRELVRKQISDLGIPAQLSWSAIDLLHSKHEMNFGRSGIYGDRFANLILQNSDLVISIGSRLAIPQLSYDPNDFARHAKVVVVDIDPDELAKFVGERWLPVQADATEFLKLFSAEIPKALNWSKWVQECTEIKESFPRREQTVSAPPEGSSAEFVNSYDVVYEISDQAGADDVFVTDMGTGLLSGFYGLDINENQKLATSLGLGEMGYGLPAAVGAQFANPEKTVICLNADGGMMMNLQELQTVAHHKLPIKLVVFSNDGYLMIKQSQKNLFDGRFVGSNGASGVSCPDFEGLASVFGFSYIRLDGTSGIKNPVTEFFETDGPVLLEVFMDPEQRFIPRVGTLKGSGGALVSPPLEDMIPLIPEEVLRNVLRGDLHPQSLLVRSSDSKPASLGRNS